MGTGSIYFKESEFFCNCGCGLDFKSINMISFDKLHQARKIAQVPFIVTSSIRCPDYNLDEGGEEDSAHLVGQAFDIFCKASHSRMIMLQAFLDAGFTRIGIGPNFIHVDDDRNKPQNVIWIY